MTQIYLLTFYSIFSILCLLGSSFHNGSLFSTQEQLLDNEQTNRDDLEYALDEEGDFFEGDIILSAGEVFETVSKDGIFRLKNMVINKNKLWPEKTVHYAFSNQFNSTQMKKVIEAFEDLQNMSCVKFLPRTTQDSYVYINKDLGCSSFVGFDTGIRNLSLSNGCLTRRGTIQHEMLHNLGIWHEQSRHDRDNYISIEKKNVLKDYLINYNGRTSNEATSMGIPYSFGSVMHYRSNQFAKNRKKPVIIPKNPAIKTSMMGQRERVSPEDVAKLNRLYNCDDSIYYVGNNITGAKPWTFSTNATIH